jgi:hypothetical protein
MGEHDRGPRWWRGSGRDLAPSARKAQVHHGRDDERGEHRHPESFHSAPLDDGYRRDGAQGEAGRAAEREERVASTSSLPFADTHRIRGTGGVERRAPESADDEEGHQHAERRSESDRGDEDAGDQGTEHRERPPTESVCGVAEQGLRKRAGDRVSHGERGGERDREAEVVHDARQQRRHERRIHVRDAVRDRDHERDAHAPTRGDGAIDGRRDDLHGLCGSERSNEDPTGDPRESLTITVAPTRDHRLWRALAAGDNVCFPCASSSF